MSRLSLQIALQSFLVVHLLTSSTVAVSNSSVGSLETKCTDGERRALLKFKDNLEVNTCHNLSSWGNEEEKKDCCSWDGIGCDYSTGHVITLDLSGYHLSARGKYISPPLIELRYLNYLDLSFNHLSGNSFSSLIGNDMVSLQHLNLSFSHLEGPLPESFGNNMTSLSCLDLSFNDLKGPIPQVFGNLSSLKYLYLDNNKLEGEIPKSIWNICTLGVLSMGSNNLSGKLPELNQSSSTRCSNHSLTKLVLRDNRLMGLSPSLSLFSSLEYLDLSSNQISGSVHPSIGRLSHLSHLDISINSLEGIISEAHFSELSQLEHLDLSSNKLIFNVTSAWVPAFRLKTISLSSCKLGPKFPKWLQTQAGFSFLDISNAGISDPIPNLFWTTSITTSALVNASHNQIRGRIANSSIEWGFNPEIDLSSNQLEGAIPMFLFQANSLHLSRNKFSSLNLMCDVTTGDATLSFLDASRNKLSGKLPDCWSYFKNLVVVNLANNKGLSGEIPSSIGSLTGIRSLRLSNNKFTGELPLLMKKCKELVVMDVGDNELSGPIPTWIGETLENLVVLIARANNFNGSIPTSLCHLPHLQLLDLSANKISGSIPKCLYNFSALRSTNTSDISIAIEHVHYILRCRTDPSCGPLVPIDFRWRMNYTDKIELIWKRNLYEYGNTLRLVKSIDLSSNMLAGQIPAEVTELVALVSLNLSRNSFSGQIPREIGKLKSLDSLDLSNNQLWGQIPPSLALIDRLGVLDLSNNNLSGKIPTSTQLQSFNADAYMGNSGLCGDPLPNKCAGEEEPITPPSASTTEEDQEDEFITHGFYVSLGVGYVVGFWGVLGTLIFNKSWRFAFFKFLNDLANWIYVMVAVRKAKLLRTLQG